MAFTLVTPSLSHLPSSTYNHVYEPAEDSFLLLDALEDDYEDLQKYRNAVCLEMGSGTGILSTGLGSILGPETLYIATDINPYACKATQSTFTAHALPHIVIQTSFGNGLLSRIQGCVDILIFNFPYVPSSPVLSPSSLSPLTTSSEDRSLAWISASWKGGRSGREVIDAWIEEGWMEKLLSERGRCYIVCLEINDADGIVRWAEGLGGWRAEVVKRRRAGGEKLCIIRFMRIIRT